MLPELKDCRAEVLPGGDADHKTVIELLANNNNLFREARLHKPAGNIQQNMFGEG